MRLVTAATIIAEIRRRAEVRAQYISDAELLAWVNLGLCALLDLVLEENETFNLRSGTINLVSGTSSYALPSDFYVLRGVEVLDTDAKWKRLAPFVWEQRPRQVAEDVARTSVKYELGGIMVDPTGLETPGGPSVALYPAPNWTQSAGLRVWYVPRLTDLVLASAGPPAVTANKVDLSNGWDEFIVQWCVVRVRAKMQEDPATDIALLRESSERIRRSARKRDLSPPGRIADATGEDAGEDDLRWAQDQPT